MNLNNIRYTWLIRIQTICSCALIQVNLSINCYLLWRFTFCDFNVEKKVIYTILFILLLHG